MAWGSIVAPRTTVLTNLLLFGCFSPAINSPPFHHFPDSSRNTHKSGGAGNEVLIGVGYRCLPLCALPWPCLCMNPPHPKLAPLPSPRCHPAGCLPGSPRHSKRHPNPTPGWHMASRPGHSTKAVSPRRCRTLRKQPFWPISAQRPGWQNPGYGEGGPVGPAPWGSPRPPSHASCPPPCRCRPPLQVAFVGRHLLPFVGLLQADQKSSVRGADWLFFEV